MNTVENIASIYNLYVDDMLTYAIYLGFERNVAMDAIHDVFCKFVERKLKLHHVENQKYYLLRALKNRLFDIYRNQLEEVDISEVSDLDPIFNVNISIEDVIIDKELKMQIENQIKDMLDTLTDRQREVVYLRYIQEYDYEQISQLMDITVHGCRKLLSKAMQNLRAKYGAITMLLLLG